MTSALAPLAKGSLPPSGLGGLAVLSPVMAEGEHAATRYVEFFTAQISQPEHPRCLCPCGVRLLRLV